MPYLVPLQGVVGGKRTLVLLENLSEKSSYSLFFQIITGHLFNIIRLNLLLYFHFIYITIDSLKDIGHELNFFQIDDPNLVLKSFGEYLYDDIILFSSTDNFSSITIGSILDFINDGNNLIFATNENIGDGLRLFAEGIGIDFETGKSLVVDHFSFDSYSDPRFFLFIFFFFPVFYFFNL